MPTATAPSFESRGESFWNSAREVKLRGRVAALEPVEGASALLMNVDPVAREVSTAAGSGEIMYAASDAADSVYQEVARPSQQKHATRTTDEYSARLDLSRRWAESRMKTGGAFSRTLPSALRMRTAPPRPGPGNHCCWPA